jgi:hypothetical protein
VRWVYVLGDEATCGGKTESGRRIAWSFLPSTVRDAARIAGPRSADGDLEHVHVACC